VAQDIVTGLAAWVRSVNQQGGIHGRRLQLVTRDDGFNPARTADNATTLSDTAFVLAAPLGTPHTMALMKATESGALPVMCPFTGAERLRSMHDHRLFHIRAGYRDEVEKMIEQLTTLGTTRFALFYQNDAFGEEGLQHVESALRKRGLEIAGKASYERGNNDISAAAATLAQGNAQAVILFSITQAGADLVKMMKIAGSTSQFISISLNGNADFVEALGEHQRGVANTQVVPYPWKRSTPLVKAYQQAMRESGRDHYSYNSLEGYLCGRIIGEGIRGATPALTRSRFINALETLTRFDAGGHEISFSAQDHIGSRFVELTIIDGSGRFLR
jgi:ABC-type branched-subunit amino acid transport system substrate-binding protein